jgi:hypothetical protein
MGGAGLTSAYAKPDAIAVLVFAFQMRIVKRKSSSVWE